MRGGHVQRKVLKAGNQDSEIFGFERLTLLNIMVTIRFIIIIM